MLELTIANDIRFRASGLPASVIEALKDRLTMPNPAYIDNEKYGRYNGNTPQHLSFIGIEGDAVTIPRGFVYQLITLLKVYRVSYKINNCMTAFKPVSFSFTGKLFPYQKEAVEAILTREYGVLCAPTGSGKTVIALAAIAKRQQPTLIICHTKALLHQWQQRAIQYLGLKENEVGFIGDGRKTIGRLTIGIINSLYGVVNDIKDRFGFLVIDEAHHCPSRTFTAVVSSFSACYMLGLSATPYRRDRLTRVIYFYLGDKVHEIETAVLQNKGHILTATLEVIETDFDYDYADDYTSMISALTCDEARNSLILSTLRGHIKTDTGISLVLSDRKEHCRALYDALIERGIEAGLLLGDTPAGQRRKITDDLYAGKYRVLVATSSLIGEGFDLPAVSSIFLTMPVKFSGRLVQYIGRALRTSTGKATARVFDFLDRNPILKASFKSRLYTYKKLGIVEADKAEYAV